MFVTLLNFDEFNSNYWWIYLVLVSVIAVSCLIILITKRKETKRKNNEVAKQNSNLNNLYSYLGDKENVIFHELKGTRLTLVLKDYQKVDREKLKEIGVERVLSMSNKYILVGKTSDLEKINKNLED